MRHFSIPNIVRRCQAVFIVLASLFFPAVGSAQIPAPLNVSVVAADPARPLVYGLHQSGEGAGALVVFNTANRIVTHSIPVGNFPSDLAVRPDGSALYVLNSGSKSISKIDLTSLAVVKTTSLTQFGTWSSDITVTPGNIGLGPGDVVYYTDGAWGPALHAINFETGQHLQKTQFRSSTDNDGFGDFVISPDGTHLFAWKQLGWTAGNVGTFVARYGVSASGLLTFESSGTNEFTGSWNRNPLDTPALMDLSGDTLVIKNRVVDQSNPMVFPRSFPEEVYAMSSGGGVVGAVENLYDARTTEVLAVLPDLGPVQCFSQDGSLLVYFNGGTKSFEVVDLVDLLGIEVLGLEVSPTRFSVGPSPETFDWFARAGATSYRVFLGNSEAAVESAGPGSGLIIGQTANLSLPNPSPLNPGTYFWRVDAITPQGILKGDVVPFSVSTVSLSNGRLDFGDLVGIQTSTRSMPITKAGGAEVAWSASPNHPWLSLLSSSGTTPSSLEVVANVTGLGVGLHEGSITLVANGVAIIVPVSVRKEALNYTHLEADGQLPYIYGISQVSESSTSPAHLLRIDALTGEVLDSVEVGSSVTDLEIHYQENRIYVTNWMAGKLRALDRNTLEEVQTYPFAPFGGTGYGGRDVYRISAGKAGRLVVEAEDQWIDVSLFDTTTGAVLDTSYEREGGGIFDPTGRYYYHGDNNSSGSEFHRFDTNGDNFVELGAVRATGVSYYGGRTVKRSADGTRYYWNGTAFDAQLNVLWTINEEIQAVSRHGDAVFTPGEIRSGLTGAILASLPVSTSVMAISGSQRNLFLASGPNLTKLDLSTLIDLPGAGILPSLADGSTVIGTDQNLAWSLDPFATAYKVYFGTSQAAVEAADEASGEYLGTVSVGEISLPWDLVLGGQYYWRVDAVGFLGAVTGPTWSFDVAPFEIQPSRLSLSIISGIKVTRELNLSATTAVAWTAAVPPSGQLALSENGGTTPASLEVTIDSTELTVGSHSRTISFAAAGKTFTFPVEIEVLSLNYTHLEADGQLPYIYAVSQVSESSTSPAHLLRIDSATGQLLDAVPVGSSVSDLEIHYPENRIYVTNWMTGKLRALDRTTLEEVQVYSFVPFAEGSNGGDAYRISAGKAGRLVVEEKDQWIDVSLIDTATGVVLNRTYEREGGGVSDPTGRYYYHGDNNSSGSEFHRFDMEAGNFVEMAAVRTIGTSYYGSRTVTRTADGTRYFWNGTSFDAQLNVLWMINEDIQEASRHGDAVFTAGEVRNGATGAVIASLPSSTSIMALAGDQQNLFLASGGVLNVVDLSTILELPGAGMQPSLVDGATVIGVDQALGWSLDPFASGYKVYFGTSLAEVQAADEASPEYLGVVNGGELTLPEELVPGGRYFWRVDAVGFLGTVAGAVWSFEVAPIDIRPARLSISLPSGSSMTRELVLSAASPVEWSASVAASGVLELSESAGTAPSTMSVTVDVAGVAPGTHARSITFNAEGKTFVVPVDIQVLNLNYTHLESDAQLPYLYGITQVSESSTSPAYLLRIDALTGAVLDSVPVGSSVSDLEVHYAENRIYITNWMTGKLRALDRTTLEEVRVYSFLPYGGSGSSGGDVYRIAAGKAGRLILEEKDQWIDVQLLNTNSGAILRSANAREGGGTSDPTGRYYYHGDNNISDASLRRFDTNGDNLNLLSSVRTVGLSYYGDRKVVMSGDGTRVFWNGTAHDAQLNVLWTGNRRIDAVTSNGRVVFSTGKVLSGWTGAVIANLPVTSPIMAVSFNQESLFLASGSTLTKLNLGDLILPPGEEIVPMISNGSTVVGAEQELSWSAAPRAEAYKVFIGRSEALVDAANESSPEYLGEMASNSFDLSGLISPGEIYFWRVDAVGALETTRGEVWSFGVDQVVMQPDVMIGLSPGSSLGDDHYSAIGANQTVSAKLKSKRPGSVYFWSENDGNKEGHFSLTSTRGNRNLAVSYMQTSPSVANVTATITLPGGSKLTSQAPGSKAGVRAVVRRAKTAKGKRSSLQLFFRAVSDENGANDAAKGIINQKN